MPARSKAQFRLMKAVEHNPKIAKKVGMSSSAAAEYTHSNVKGKAYGRLPEKRRKYDDGGKVTPPPSDPLAANDGTRPWTPEEIAYKPKVVVRKPVVTPPTVTKTTKEAEANDRRLVNTLNQKKGGKVSLSVGRGEKLSTSRGAGLTAKGRAKYNRETGSHLKAPQPEGGSRKDSFCARMSGVVKHSKGSADRAKASLRRWKCPSW